MMSLYKQSRKQKLYPCRCMQGSSYIFYQATSQEEIPPRLPPHTTKPKTIHPSSKDIMKEKEPITFGADRNQARGSSQDDPVPLRSPGQRGKAKKNLLSRQTCSGLRSKHRTDYGITNTYKIKSEGDMNQEAGGWIHDSQSVNSEVSFTE